MLISHSERVIAVYKLPDMKQLQLLAVPNEMRSSFVNDVAISDDCKWLIAVGTTTIYAFIAGYVLKHHDVAGDAREIWIYDISGERRFLVSKLGKFTPHLHYI